MKQILLVTLSILLFTACSDYETQVIYEKNQVLFQYQYINYAWVYQRNGLYIDAAAKVWSFDKPQSWNEVDAKTQLIDYSKLSQNISECNLVLVKVDSIQLLKNVELINGAALGKLSNPVSVMADAGIHKYVAFQYNNRTKTYKEVLIYQWGDLEIINNSDEAKKIKLWLDSLFK